MTPYSFMQRAGLSMTDKFQSPIIRVWLHIQKVTIYIGALHNSLAPWLDRRLMKPAAWFTLGCLFPPRNDTTHKREAFFSFFFLPTYWAARKEQGLFTYNYFPLQHCQAKWGLMFVWELYATPLDLTPQERNLLVSGAYNLSKNKNAAEWCSPLLCEGVFVVSQTP